ncbi:MAG: cytochrome c3 family protein [Planctomycetia bacterium]|nr:cytochrome c3 family protein [Planctomycetia bacterium]
MRLRRRHLIWPLAAGLLAVMAVGDFPLSLWERAGVRAASVTAAGATAAEADPPAAKAAEAKPAKPAEPSGEKIDPMSVNATCYVCHMAFVREEISKVHFKAKVTCVQCHGVSAPHANDERIGATKPDITYRRDQVDAMCEKCHKTHDAPAQKVIARYVERKPAKSPVVCTECHGEHKIAAAEGEKSPAK